MQLVAVDRNLFGGFACFQNFASPLREDRHWSRLHPYTESVSRMELPDEHPPAAGDELP